MRSIVASMVVLLSGAASARERRDKPSAVGATIDRGLAFLTKDALPWKKEHNCASCHQATDLGTSDESMTALATLAVLPAAAAGDASAKAVRDKGIHWLAKTKTDDDPQSIAMRLALWRRLGRPANEWEPLVQHIKKRQN